MHQPLHPFPGGAETVARARLQVAGVNLNPRRGSWQGVGRRAGGHSSVELDEGDRLEHVSELADQPACRLSPPGAVQVDRVEDRRLLAWRRAVLPGELLLRAGQARLCRSEHELDDRPAGGFVDPVFASALRVGSRAAASRDAVVDSGASARHTPHPTACARARRPPRMPIELPPAAAGVHGAGSALTTSATDPRRVAPLRRTAEIGLDACAPPGERRLFA